MERAIPILPANHLRIAKECNVNRLRFGVRFEATEDGTTGLLGVDRGSISLTLDCPMSGHGREACVSPQVEDADGEDAACSALGQGGSHPAGQADVIMNLVLSNTCWEDA